MGWEKIYMNNKIYFCGYDLDRYELRKFDCQDNSIEDSPYSTLLNKSEWNPLIFVKAYNIIIGETEYVAEEWKMENLNNEITVYSIDGVIKGYEGNFYGEPVVFTVIKFEKQADTNLIQIPQNISSVNYGD